MTTITVNDNQFVITIGDRKKVIFAEVLSETKAMTCVISLANTHTNRCLVAEKEVSELKANHNCTTHMYKVKNHKFKTVHRCYVYNIENTQDRLTFMDNLVKFLMIRRFPDDKKTLQIFEFMRTKGKDAWIVSTRKLKENPKATVFLRPPVYHKQKKKRNHAKDKSSCQSSQPPRPSSSKAPSETKERTILQIPAPSTYVNMVNLKESRIRQEMRLKRKLLYIQKRVLSTRNMSRRVTRSVTQKDVPSDDSKSNDA